MQISRDDGATFGAVIANLRGSISAIAELAGEVLLAAGPYVYCVRTSELLGENAPGSSAGVRPVVRTKPRPTPARPLSSYPQVIRTRVWRIEQLDPSKAYSASTRDDEVRVLEQGSRVVFSKRLPRAFPGRFVVRKNWLVYETYPREVERNKLLRAQAAWDWGTARTLPARVLPAR